MVEFTDLTCGNVLDWCIFCLYSERNQKKSLTFQVDMWFPSSTEKSTPGINLPNFNPKPWTPVSAEGTWIPTERYSKKSDPQYLRVVNESREGRLVETPMLMFQVELLRRSPKNLLHFDPKYLHKSWDTHVQCLFSQFCHLYKFKKTKQCALWKGPWRRDVAMWNNDPCGKTREHLNNYTRLSPSPEIIKSSADSREVRNPFLMALQFVSCMRSNAFIRRWWTWILTAVWNWCCSRIWQASWLNNQHVVNLSLPTNRPASVFHIVNCLVLHLKSHEPTSPLPCYLNHILHPMTSLNTLQDPMKNPGCNLLVHKFPDLKKTCWRLKS